MCRKIIPYNPILKERARYLRNNSTLSEILLWKQLKGKQLRGYDFHRQKPIDQYIVDFYCAELSLAIEIDGLSHDDTKVDYDSQREQRLNQLGVHVIRFTDDVVKQNVMGVVEAIELWIDEQETHPQPLPRGEFEIPLHRRG